MSTKKYRILIVEDEESLLKLETILLSSRGYHVSAVSDGGEALKEIDRLRPDLVILDVMLPGMDGFEICTRLKGDPATAGIPIIMLTARKNSQDVERGQKAGANAYITKPFKSVNLLATIEGLLGGGLRG